MHVPGEGPTPCEFVVIGEGPGWEEDKCGRPFVGKTGDEIDRFFDGASLPARRDIFLTNIFRDYQGKDYTFTAEDLQRDEPELLRELKKVKPRILVPLGRYATRWLLGDVDMEGVWGIPWVLPKDEKLAFLDKDATVFPIHHPASGFHNPEMSPYVVAGFQQLAAYLDGETQPRILYDDPYPRPQYEEITNEAELSRACRQISAGQLLSIDTEGWPHNPWSLQFSTRPGRGYCIRKTRPELLRTFIEIIHRVRPRLLFHSALHDLSMGRALRTDFEGLPFDDTMVMAYLLQLEAQGLKAGCLRHCNMRMDSYEDILGDAGNRLAYDYLTWIWDLEQVRYEEDQQTAFIALTTTPYLDKRGTLQPGRRLKVPPKLPRSPLQKAVQRCLSSKRPRQLWEEQVEDVTVSGYARLGSMPEATLDYVPLPTAIHYGCRDTDGTLRYRHQLGPRIDAMGLRDVYNLELATYPLIDRMARIGLKPDLGHFSQLSEKLADEIENIQASLVEQTGLGDFNANSGDQVAAYLFGTLGIDEMTMTKGGRGSTNDKILEALEHEHPEHPILSTIRTYRETYKLKNTFCLDPTTRVLTSDLRWVPIDTLDKGNRLLAFDEDGAPRGSGRDHDRHWKHASVLSSKIVTKPCYRLTFSDGTSVICSTDHRWLARSVGTYQRATWVRTDKLLATDRAKQTKYDCEIIKPLSVWNCNNDYASGYLAASFDSEGCLQKPKWSIRLSYTQNVGPTLHNVDRLLRQGNFKPSESITRDGRCCHLNIGRSAEVIRFLGTYRPLRLLAKFASLSSLPRMNCTNTVSLVKREYLGLRDVVAIETDSHTFVAEGLASHNCDRLPDFVDKWPHDGRIHSTFRTTRVITGRLAASEPNVLAQPEHGKFAPHFKRGWVAEKGHVLCQWDESQIELRGLAHLSQDPVMLAIFRGELRNPDGSLIDLHAATAERIFGVKPKNQDKSKHRLPAKAIGFGIPMGMTCKGLSVELRKNGVDADEDTAQRWLDETLGLYKGVKTYMKQRIAEAYRQGYVRCLSGRIRYIGGIRSKNARVREEAERFAFSTPIQESATFIMKQAEVSVYEDICVPLWKQGVYVEPILQVHDCLKMECQEGLEQDLHLMMGEVMTHVPKGFSVPLAVEGEYGWNMAPVELKGPDGQPDPEWSNPKGMRSF